MWEKDALKMRQSHNLGVTLMSVQRSKHVSDCEVYMVSLLASTISGTHRFTDILILFCWVGLPESDILCKTWQGVFISIVAKPFLQKWMSICQLAIFEMVWKNILHFCEHFRFSAFNHSIKCSSSLGGGYKLWRYCPTTLWSLSVMLKILLF